MAQAKIPGHLSGESNRRKRVKIKYLKQRVFVQSGKGKEMTSGEEKSEGKKRPPHCR